MDSAAQQQVFISPRIAPKIEAKGSPGLFDPSCRPRNLPSVSVDNLEDHEMHSEFYQLSEEAAATLRQVKLQENASWPSERLLFELLKRLETI